MSIGFFVAQRAEPVEPTVAFVALSRRYSGSMRVHELAAELHIEARTLIDLLRSDGEWVASHLSSVPDPVAQRIIADPPPPSRAARPQVRSTPGPALRSDSFAPFPREVSAPKRRRPGPARIMLKARQSDGDFRVGRPRPRGAERMTTRDAAFACGVSMSTIRQWVHRGYLVPVGKEGPAHVFDAYDVQVASDSVKDRTRRPGRKVEPGRWSLYAFDGLSIPAKHHNVLVDIDQAAGLVSVAPSTIRSWIRRGHLTPSPTSRPRHTRIRIGDVLAASRRGDGRSRR